jgi:3-hydroxy-3-methylglutaryl CoA synthase
MAEIARIWGWHPEQYRGLAVDEKAIAGPDEDSVTMGYEAARNAIARARSGRGK